MWKQNLINMTRSFFWWLDQFNLEPDPPYMPSPANYQIQLTSQYGEIKHGTDVNRKPQIMTMLEVSVEERGWKSVFKTRSMNLRNIMKWRNGDRVERPSHPPIPTSSQWWLPKEEIGDGTVVCEQEDSLALSNDQELVDISQSTDSSSLNSASSSDRTATWIFTSSFETTPSDDSEGNSLMDTPPPNAQPRPTRHHTFKTNIRRLSKRIQPRRCISREALHDMHHIVLSLLDIVASSASLLAAHENKKTLSERHIETAIRMTLTPKLGMHAIQNGRTAVDLIGKGRDSSVKVD